MARIDNLNNYLTDVASAIKTMREYDSNTLIKASDFDTEIKKIDTVKAATDVTYDGTTSGLTGATVQAAIDELSSEKQEKLIAGDNIIIDNTNKISAIVPKITVDNAPTEGSTNPVSSGGVYTALSGIKTIKLQIVTVLPETGESNIIYLVQSAVSQEHDFYDEYMYFNDNWERIGSTKVNMADYYNKTEIDTKETTLNNTISTKANIADVYNKTEIDAKETNLNNTKANISDVYNKTEIDAKQLLKQDKLTAGDNVTISNNVISVGKDYYLVTGNSETNRFYLVDAKPGVYQFVNYPFTDATLIYNFNLQTRIYYYTSTDSTTAQYIDTLDGRLIIPKTVPFSYISYYATYALYLANDGTYMKLGAVAGHSSPAQRFDAAVGNPKHILSTGGTFTVLPTSTVVPSTDKDLVNKLYVDTQDKTKQDTLVSGTNIKTVNGSSILGSGDISILSSYDNKSINVTSDGKLQTVGIIDTNSGNADKLWTGTLVQYNAITSKDADTTYIITDDDLGYETTTNKVTSLSSTSTDSQYPTAKCVYDLVGNIETLLSSI